MSYKVCLLASAVAPRTGKIIKKIPSVFERGEHFLQNGVFRLSQLSGITSES